MSCVACGWKFGSSRKLGDVKSLAMVTTEPVNLSRPMGCPVAVDVVGAVGGAGRARCDGGGWR